MNMAQTQKAIATAERQLQKYREDNFCLISAKWAHYCRRNKTGMAAVRLVGFLASKGELK